ncbi:kinase-like domain-containing protein, partial [Spinellus fusiger]
PPKSPTHTTPRFHVFDDGTHAHHLSFQPSRLSLSNLTHLLNRNPSKGFHLSLLGEKKTPLAALKEERAAVDATLNRGPSDACLAQKWGNCQKIIGKGAFGIVSVVHKTEVGGGREVLYAVKELPRKHTESTRSYVKRLTSEFCISSSLHHHNVIKTLDLLPMSETSLVYCQVMEYCEGGDLFRIVCESSNGLETAEAHCFFKQLLYGIDYLHSKGVAHRDIKPENLILTSTGCLKISDFGSAQCFRSVSFQQDSEKIPGHVYYSTGVCGSEPYIAPEEYTLIEYDPRCVDVWSAAITFMAMKTGTHMWSIAKEHEDSSFDRYLKFRRLLDDERERAHMNIKRLMYRMLDPNPSKRITVKEIVKNRWFLSIACCQ